MKKIMNQPETLVTEMCSGLVMAHPELEFLPKYKVIKKKKLNADRVTLISGGGSGHEPAHAGLVGEGMLDAAVCGDIFASPSQVQVYQAIRATAGDRGALLIIKNYSGDVMNFNNAAALAAEDGIDVEIVRVDDDIAVEDSLYTVGRRGVAGTVLVHKIAGAAADEGRTLPQVKAAAEKAAKQVRSIGVALTSCTVPAHGAPTFRLGEDEIEYGVGIHGEPGQRREKLVSADELAGRMTAELLNDLGIEAAVVGGGAAGDASGDDNGAAEIAVLVNGFGATPLQELYLFNNAVVRELAKRNVRIIRTFVGNYMTSIDMAGLSLTFMKLDDELRALLAKPCRTPGFRVDDEAVPAVEYAGVEEADSASASASYTVETPASHAVIRDEQLTLDNIVYIVDKMSEVIIANEVPFCELDAHAGDGDFGMSVARGFKQLKREWPSILAQPSLTIGSFLDACSIVIMEHCGGASGPIWGSAFRAAGKYAGDRIALSAQEFAGMADAAVRGIQATGERAFGRGAVVGDKTLIDALVPFAAAWQEGAAAGMPIARLFKQAAEAAVAGAERTKQFAARMGRAGNVGERSLGHPDAGAFALGVILTEIALDLK